MHSNLLLDTNVKKMNCRLSFSSAWTALIRYVSNFTGDLFIGQDAKHLNRLLCSEASRFFTLLCPLKITGIARIKL